MTKFYNGITIALKLYKNSKTSKNKPTTNTTDRYIIPKNPNDQAVDKAIDNDTTCDKINANQSKRILESNNSSESNIRSKVITDRTVNKNDNTDPTQKGSNTYSKVPTTSCDNSDTTNSLMLVNKDYDNISVEGEMLMSMLLASECNHHLTNTHLRLTDYTANDDKDSLNLGNVKLGNNSNIFITGYGNKNPFSRKLVVLSLFLIFSSLLPY